MTWLISGLAGLLLLAVPASIARASLVGAIVVIAVLAAFAAGAVTVLARRRGRSPNRRYAQIAVVAVLYAGVVTLIHLTG